MRAQDVLPDTINQVQIEGVTVRKGSVAAFLSNAVALTDPATDGDAAEIARQDIREALPALRALRLFEVLEIRDPELRAFVEGCR